MRVKAKPGMYAMGWKEIHVRQQEVDRAAFRNKVGGVILMGLFGAFTAILFFMGTCAQ